MKLTKSVLILSALVTIAAASAFAEGKGTSGASDTNCAGQSDGKAKKLPEDAASAEAEAKSAGSATGGTPPAPKSN